MDIRTHLPAEALAKDPALVVTEGLGLSLSSLPPATPKIIVTQRQGAEDEQAWLQTTALAIRAGWISVLEYDDHPRLTYAAIGKTLDEAGWRHFSQFHALQTSTERLAELFRPWNPNVAVFPNAVFDLPPLRPRSGPPRLFYGAVKRGPIAVEVMRSLADVLAAHPEVKVVVVGDAEVFDVVPTPNKLFKGYLSFEDYNRLMAMCDITLSPLADTEGQDCKSDAKFLDAGRNGLALIASPNVYAETVVDGETGFIARAPADWAAILAMLIEKPDVRTRVAAAAWDYVRRHRMFTQQIASRRDWYLQLWQDRHALTSQLVQRAPALRAMLTRQAG